MFFVGSSLLHIFFSHLTYSLWPFSLNPCVLLCYFLLFPNICMLNRFQGLLQTSLPHFSSPNSTPMSLENEWIIFISLSRLYSSPAYNFRSSINRSWLMLSLALSAFFLLLLRLYPIFSFYICLLRGSIAIQNKSGERLSPWKMPLWTFTLGIFISPLLCLRVIFVFQFFI